METFARVLEETKTVSLIEPAAQPAGFVGRRRDYQTKAWLDALPAAFLLFGGCQLTTWVWARPAVLARSNPARAAHRRRARRSVPGGLPVIARIHWKEEAAASLRSLAVLETYRFWSVNGNDGAAYDPELTITARCGRTAWPLSKTPSLITRADEAQWSQENAGNRIVRRPAAAGDDDTAVAVSALPGENHLGELWTLSLVFSTLKCAALPLPSRSRRGRFAIRTKKTGGRRRDRWGQVVAVCLGADQRAGGA